MDDAESLFTLYIISNSVSGAGLATPQVTPFLPRGRPGPSTYCWLEAVKGKTESSSILEYRRVLLPQLHSLLVVGTVWCPFWCSGEREEQDGHQKTKCIHRAFMVPSQYAGSKPGSFGTSALSTKICHKAYVVIPPML
jgi:hypothetical protein